jgi:hypothetical protein
MHNNSVAKIRVWKKTYSNHWIIKLLAFPFLLVGLYCILGPWLPGSGASLGIMLIVPLCGLPFAACGVWGIFYRRGLDFDRNTQFVREWWGVLLPWRTQEYHIAEFDEIALQKLTDSDAETVFEVYLAGAIRKILVQASSSYRTARKTADELSQYSGLELADDSSGRIVVRPPHPQYEPLREKVSRTGELPPHLFKTFFETPIDEPELSQREYGDSATISPDKASSTTTSAEPPVVEYVAQSWGGVDTWAEKMEDSVAQQTGWKTIGSPQISASIRVYSLVEASPNGLKYIRSVGFTMANGMVALVGLACIIGSLWAGLVAERYDGDPLIFPFITGVIFLGIAIFIFHKASLLVAFGDGVFRRDDYQCRFDDVHAVQLLPSDVENNGCEINLVLHDGRRVPVIQLCDKPSSIRSDALRICQLIGVPLWDAVRQLETHPDSLHFDQWSSS